MIIHQNSRAVLLTGYIHAVVGVLWQRIIMSWAQSLTTADLSCSNMQPAHRYPFSVLPLFPISGHHASASMLLSNSPAAMGNRVTVMSAVIGNATYWLFVQQSSHLVQLMVVIAHNISSFTEKLTIFDKDDISMYITHKTTCICIWYIRRKCHA